MIDSIVFVVRRQFWEGSDSARQEYLTGAEEWSTDPASAWTYQSVVVFGVVDSHDGAVFLRMPSGREISVTKSDFFSEDWTPLDRKVK